MTSCFCQALGTAALNDLWTQVLQFFLLWRNSIMVIMNLKYKKIKKVIISYTSTWICCMVTDVWFTLNTVWSIKSQRTQADKLIGWDDLTWPSIVTNNIITHSITAILYKKKTRKCQLNSLKVIYLLKKGSFEPCLLLLLKFKTGLLVILRQSYISLNKNPKGCQNL